MSIWLYRKIDINDVNFNLNDKTINIEDEVYIYTDDEINGGFTCNKKLFIKGNNQYEIIPLDPIIQIDIPYSVFYKTKTKDSMLKLSNKEIEFILGEKASSLVKPDIKDLFIDYVENVYVSERTNQPLSQSQKKITTRINYLEKVIPDLVNPENPTNIFSIKNRDEIEKIKSRLSDSNDLGGINNSNTYSGQLLQTVRIYLEFFDSLGKNNINLSNNQFNDDENISINNLAKESNINTFKSFIKKIEKKDEVLLDKKWNNIEFIIGQPNTGKSYNFEESRLFNLSQKDHYKYIKIPVSGGIGNEYKGLQNTDLAITYDPIKEEVRFGEFLQILMSAIVNPDVPHIIFLDDFHNQDISSLLSEYTPLFKAQQMRSIGKVNSEHLIFTKQHYENANDFINIWNDFIEKNCIDVPQVPLTNRISGESLKLVFPDNFYLFGAANFNQNSLNIFADWEDRAKIEYKKPIEDFIKSPEYIKNKDIPFVKCCIELNIKLKEVLEENNIFDNEKYCFGMWKLFDNEQKLIIDNEQQKEIIKFFFRMIKNSLRFNNKNSLINLIGKSLFIGMQSNDWFKSNIEEIKKELDDKEFYKILHTYNIYEDDI